MADGKWYETAWDHVKKFSYKWLGGLILEEKKNGELTVSLGRTLLMATMAGMAGIWWSNFQSVSIDPVEVLKALPSAENAEGVATAVVAAMHGTPKALPSGMMEVFYALSAYVFGTKVTGALKQKWTK